MRLQSPFERYLDTGYIASHQETCEIYDFLADKLSLLSQLNHQISRPIEQRDALQVFVDRHKALVSPIHHIPTEVLSEIFLRCLPSDTLPVRRTDRAPVLLACISRRWREVAISTPGLWSGLHVYIPPRSPLPTVSHKNFLTMRVKGTKLWLNRSHPHPFTLSVEMDTPFDYLIKFSEDTLRSCYEELFLSFASVDAVERWKDVKFFLSPLVASELEGFVKERKLLTGAAQLQTLRIDLKWVMTMPKAVWSPRPNPSE
ncbi:hypothetical protein PM082_013941 [Marasmius tenuissimus]|nr:hypothetical protein PM082_013941 [Marasmius tenuissimus]